MFKRTRTSLAAALVVSGFGMVGQAAHAQQSLERVEITGSAIKRIVNEGALPVQIINRAEIEKSGATSVADVIQKLPSMQGFVTSSESVNGGGGGTTTASLHSLGDKYTLVLLNGRRVAPFNTGNTVNLQNIPIAAIERVEVLSDGASALYGSDAIAGVVNFILRSDSTDGEIQVSADKVEDKGGETRSFSIVKGFGKLGSDRFNILFSYAHEEQKELNAIQRDFSKSGIIRFNENGRSVGLRLFSSNTVPGTVLLQQTPTGPDDDGFRAFYTPYLLANGACPALHVVNGQTCRFDFSSQVQLVPETKRDVILTSGKLRLGESHTLFADLMLSKAYNKPRYAPPAQPGLPLTQAMFDEHVTPYLATLGLTAGDIEPVGGDPTFAPQYNLRVFDAGGRQDKYTYDNQHLVLGSEGQLGKWDYKGAVTLSKTKWEDKAIGGYLSLVRFNQVIAGGQFDPLGDTAGTAVRALAPAVLNEVIQKQESSLNVLNFQMSSPMFATGGGDATLAVGGEYARQNFIDNPAPILQGANKLQPTYADAIVGGGGGSLPYDTTRNSWGLFSELQMPLTKSLEVTGSLRHDSISAAKNDKAFDADGNPIAPETQGKKASATTFKLSGRFVPAPDMLIRGSIGTGFRAPELNDITQPPQAFGVTSSSFDCPFAAPNPLAVGCRPPDSQYNILRGGNPTTGNTALKPEKSNQWTLGFRTEAIRNMSLGLDLWQVKMKDRIDFVPEDLAFADPDTYRDLFVIAPDPVTRVQQLTFIQTPLNLGKAVYRGIDIDAVARTTVEGLNNARLTTGLNATYMLKADYEIPGLPGYQSSLGKFGPDQKVTFRILAKITVGLETGPWAHNLTVNYKSGYRDHQAKCLVDIVADPSCAGASQWSGPEIRNVNATTGAFGGRIEYTRNVAEYMTMDWQTKYSLNKALSLTLGVRNLLDQDPPFSIQDAGGGNMRGFDGRYADPIGRTYYLKGSYKF